MSERLPKFLPTGCPGRMFPEKGVGHEFSKKLFGNRSSRRPRAPTVESLLAAAQDGNYSVDDHVSWPGVKSDHLILLRGSRQKCEVSNTAYVLKDARSLIVGKEEPISKRNKRSALPSRRHITHPEIGDGGHARSFRDHGRLTDLQSGRCPRVRQVMNRLPM